MSKSSFRNNMDRSRIVYEETRSTVSVSSNYKLTDKELKDLAEYNNRIPGYKAISFKKDPFVWMPYHFNKNGEPLKGSRFYNSLTNSIEHEN